MKKKQLIIAVLAGLLSFSSTFTVSWVMKKKQAVALAAAQQAQEARTQHVASNSEGTFFDTAALTMQAENMDETRISERQLQSLITGIRTKIKDYQDRQKSLDSEAERIEISRQSMQEDIDRLNNLQNKLTVTLADIHQKEAALKDTLTEIETLEKENFKRLASTYEKMDVKKAGLIMTTMATGNQLQDSVKILYYMNERMAGKLLAEIGDKQPELASMICMKLKRVKEIN